MRILTAIFSLFIGAIIVLANTGVLGVYVDWLHAWPGSDKIAHFLLIGTLAALVNLAGGGRRSRVCGWTVPTGSLWVMVVVALEEASQAWIPARSCSLTDLAADLAGIVVLGGLGQWLARRAVPVRDVG